jgi:hypothetical protein
LHIPTIADHKKALQLGFQVEVAVKQILADLPVKNQGALANPQSLELFKNIPETKAW